MKPINQEMNETTAYGSFFEFLEKNKDRIFRFWVYKRMFTPLEQEKMYLDQDVYEDTFAAIAKMHQRFPGLFDDDSGD